MKHFSEKAYVIFSLFLLLDLVTACQQRNVTPALPLTHPIPPTNQVSAAPSVPVVYLLPPGSLSWSIKNRISVGGETKWDFATIEPSSRRLFVAHHDEVVVIDLETKQILAHIPAHGSHGVVILPKQGLGFISNGESGNVSLFSLDTLKVVTQADAGKGPDALLHEVFTDKVIVFNAESNTACVIDPDKRKELGTIPLDGQPEFAAADGKGKVFVNLVDKDQVLTLDLTQFMLGNRWSLPAGSSPTSMAIDPVRQRLFIGCHNQKLMILNSNTGAIISTLPIGSHVDATTYDPLSQRIFVSCGDGTLQIFHQDSADVYQLESQVATLPGARTMAFDPKTGNLYLPVAETPSAPETSLNSSATNAPPANLASAVFEILELDHSP